MQDPGAILTGGQKDRRCQEGPQHTGVLCTKGHGPHLAGSREWGREDRARIRGYRPSLPLGTATKN